MALEASVCHDRPHVAVELHGSRHRQVGRRSSRERGGGHTGRKHYTKPEHRGGCPKGMPYDSKAACAYGGNTVAMHGRERNRLGSTSKSNRHPPVAALPWVRPLLIPSTPRADPPFQAAPYGGLGGFPLGLRDSSCANRAVLELSSDHIQLYNILIDSGKGWDPDKGLFSCRPHTDIWGSNEHGGRCGICCSMLLHIARRCIFEITLPTHISCGLKISSECFQGS